MVKWLFIDILFDGENVDRISLSSCFIHSRGESIQILFIGDLDNSSTKLFFTGGIFFVSFSCFFFVLLPPFLLPTWPFFVSVSRRLIHKTLIFIVKLQSLYIRLNNSMWMEWVTAIFGLKKEFADTKASKWNATQNVKKTFSEWGQNWEQSL